MDTFKNKTLQDQFADKGYVILPHLIDDVSLINLQRTFDSFTDKITQPFHTSHFSTDIDYKFRTQSAIIEIVYSKVKTFLNDYVPVFGNFMVKNKGGGNFLQMHADWTYVDERLNRSVAVWIPFVNTNISNGCLGIIESSHKFMNAIRGPRIQQNNFDRDLLWAKKYGKLLPMKAGDAIVYDHALLHFSLPNNTSQVRPALNLSLVPKNIDVIHYCVPEGSNAIEKYNVSDPDFFIHYDNFQRPRSGSPVEILPIDTVKFIDEKMENYGRAYLSRSQRLKSFFKELQFKLRR